MPPQIARSRSEIRNLDGWRLRLLFALLQGLPPDSDNVRRPAADPGALPDRLPRRAANGEPEYTATGNTPSFRRARMMRPAMTPRLTTRTFCNISGLGIENEQAKRRRIVCVGRNVKL